MIPYRLAEAVQNIAEMRAQYLREQAAQPSVIREAWQYVSSFAREFFKK